MTAVFFPFTFITESVLRSFRMFFKTIAVFQTAGDTIPDTLKAWQAKGALDIWVPLPDEGHISAMLRSYREWALHRRGGDISVHKYYREQVPFFNETSVARIKKEIRTFNETQTDGSCVDEENLLYRAGLFLQMAQEFDEQNLEIFRDLSRQARMERALFNGLKGEEGELPRSDPVPPVSPAEDTFGYMLPDRLGAWARLMLSHDVCGHVFLTHRRDAVEAAVADLPQTAADIHVQTISAFQGEADVVADLQDALTDHIVQLSQLPLTKFQEGTVPGFSKGTDDENPAMELHIIPGIDPHEFFSRFAKNSPAAADRITPRKSIKNTVLARVGPADEF
jgi:hypothetical protein